MKFRYLLFTLLAGLLLIATNSFAQWRLSTGFSNSIAAQSVQQFLSAGNYLLASAECASSDPKATRDSLFASTDNGQSWLDFAPNGGAPIIALLNPPASVVLIGSADTTPGVPSSGSILSYSNDFGQSWKPDTLAWPIKDGSATCLLSVGSTIFMGTASGVYQQTAPGLIWTPDTVGMTVSIGSIAFSFPIQALVSSGSSMIASAGLYAGLYTSTNNGASWTRSDTGLPTGSSGIQWTALGFTSSGSTLFTILTHDQGDTSYDIYHSSDNGSSWAQANTSPIILSSTIPQLAASGQYVFLCSPDSGVYVSSDNGATWANANQGLPNFSGSGVYFSAIQVSETNVVLGTLGGGIWTRPLADFANLAVGTQTPSTSLSLAESVPNPVSSDSKITYSLTSDGIATITVFDLTGRQVATLVNSFQSAGSHTVNFDGSTLPAGMYMYRLESSRQSVSKALQLIR